MPISATVTHEVALDVTKDNAPGTARYAETGRAVRSYSDGSGTNQATRVHRRSYTVASGGSQALDLAGVLLDPVGDTLNAANLKAIQIEAAAGNTTRLSFGPGASNPVSGLMTGTTPRITLDAGEAFTWSSPTGRTVVAGTGDQLTVDNAAGASATFTVTILVG